ncbi:MAG: hypothetical protein JKY52_18375, partial [Flavobacteriales bacterium]|nr:hypothetical protein [Flavobacteriales bacterium]
MTNITLYQSIPSHRPLPTLRLIKSLLNTNCKVALDLEDGIQDILNPALTTGLKEQARKDFAEIIHQLPHKKISLRINAIRSNEFQKDLALLHQYADHIESIIIPKTETSEDLAIFCKAFGPTHKINLVVETQRGIDNIDEILNSNYSDLIEFVFFGNYDFHLDNNTYPITEQGSLNYWSIVEPIIASVESHKKSFGNSPYANIADTDCLDFALMQLKKRCKRKFGMMSLHKTQTTYIQKNIANNGTVKTHSNRINHDTFTLESFVNNTQKGRSFAFDNKRIITPQEYLLLLRKQHG